MHSDPPDKGDGKIARIGEQQLEGVYHDGNELDHLEDGQVLFPPQVLLHLWPHGGKHVISVHHNVNSGVEESEERWVAARGEFNAPPDCEGENNDEIVKGNAKGISMTLTTEGHDAVMYHMERWHLIISLSHYEKECIEKLGELAEIIPPRSVSHLQTNWWNISQKLLLKSFYLPAFLLRPAPLIDICSCSR